VEDRVGRYPRYHPPTERETTLVEVTSRVIQGRALLRPSTKVNRRIIGVIGRAQRLYEVKIHGIGFLSTHGNSSARSSTRSSKPCSCAPSACGLSARRSVQSRRRDSVVHAACAVQPWSRACARTNERFPLKPGGLEAGKNLSKEVGRLHEWSGPMWGSGTAESR